MFRATRNSGFILVTTTLALTACINNTNPCVENLQATINVAGTYRYFGDTIYLLRGTITFAQEGNLVSVAGTTYDNSGDRDLVSDPTPLQGNKLAIVLVPKNGDTDYRADVTFIFNNDGSEFCVEFSDTNGDAGDLGTYRGVKL